MSHLQREKRQDSLRRSPDSSGLLKSFFAIVHGPLACHCLLGYLPPHPLFLWLLTCLRRQASTNNPLLTTYYQQSPTNH